MRHRYDVAIYAPSAYTWYSSEWTRAQGGRERQTTLIAQGLASEGLRVAHIVYSLPGPRALPLPAPEVIERGEWRPETGPLAAIPEIVAIWRALLKADARVYIFRGGGVPVSVGAAFCKVFRRKLLFSGANDLDFDFERPDRRRLVLFLSRHGLRRADAIVAQTQQQLELARGVLPRNGATVVIPSFADLGETAATTATPAPEAFLWADRLVAYKSPHRYVELAEAVPQARFWMVGMSSTETPPGMVDEMRQAADRLPNLEFFGRPQPREQLLAMMRRSAALVTTSQAEGMPNTFLEAWALKVPVLSYRFDPDGTIAARGLGLVSGGSPERFAEAAQRLWSDADFRVAAGERARAYLEQAHAPDAVLRQWMSIVEATLEDSVR